MLSSIAFVFGLFAGAFLNSCIDTLPYGKPMNPFSLPCPSCKELATLYERIPLLGYLLSGGKCSQCNTPTSLRYPAIELAAAFVCFFLFRKYGLSLDFFLKTFFVLLLILISLIDLNSGTIPDVLSIGGLSVGLVLAFFRKPFFFYQDALYGIAVGGALFAVVFCCRKFFRKEVMGFGDIKLLCAIGAFCGFKGALFSIVAASVIGALIGIPLMLTKGKDAKYAIPFGPFLSLGALLFMTFGDRFVYGFLSYISGRTI